VLAGAAVTGNRKIGGSCRESANNGRVMWLEKSASISISMDTQYMVEQLRREVDLIIGCGNYQ
jgi:hypothetical protein